MNQEYEVKFLDIDIPKLEKKLEEIGAEKVGEFFYRRISFDFPDLSLNAKGAWVRLRDEGDRVTMTWKRRLGVKANKITMKFFAPPVRTDTGRCPSVGFCFLGL